MAHFFLPFLKRQGGAEALLGRKGAKTLKAIRKLLDGMID